MKIDYRHLDTGLRIPSVEGGYVDQPYVVVNPDGSWTCVMTTGSGHEGDAGQHVASTVSRDQGKTWSPLVPVEPVDGPEASWAQPLLVPETGRIYVFYTFNKANQRQVKTVDGRMINRVDSLGTFAYRYSDDGGLTWSADRYEVPMRVFEIDRRNVYGGEVQFFWGVSKPFIHEDEACVGISKVGGFGPGFFVENEGVLFASPNLATEHDPAKHVWETRPDGDIGVRGPDGCGPISGEFKATPMNDGSFYATLRTIDGYALHAYSRDRGRNWQSDWMRYAPANSDAPAAGKKVKNPRSANFSWRCSNGKYLYWFNNHGGEPLGRLCRDKPHLGYEHRNPTFLCGGVERDGQIHWSQPEIILYHENIGDRWSYPDLIEQDGRYFVTETQKAIARVHELDRAMLEAMWQQGEERSVTRDGLLVEHTGGPGKIDMPELPTLHDRGAGTLDPGTGATLAGEAMAVEQPGGFSVEMWLTLDDLTPWQMLFDSRDEQGLGMTVMLTDRGALRLTLNGHTFGQPGGRRTAGQCESSWDCDAGLIEAGRKHHVVFIVDGGPKLISVVVDGVLCDGGSTRQYGWGRFNRALRDANGNPTAHIAPDLRGTLHTLRLYDRYLLTSEAVANFLAGA